MCACARICVCICVCPADLKLTFPSELLDDPELQTGRKGEEQIDVSVKSSFEKEEEEEGLEQVLEDCVVCSDSESAAPQLLLLHPAGDCSSGLRDGVCSGGRV